MAERASVSVPMSPELLASLDAMVAAGVESGVYPRPTRASVVRSLISQGCLAWERARAKAKPEAA